MNFYGRYGKMHCRIVKREIREVEKIISHDKSRMLAKMRPFTAIYRAVNILDTHGYTLCKTCPGGGTFLPTPLHRDLFLRNISQSNLQNIRACCRTDYSFVRLFVQKSVYPEKSRDLLGSISGPHNIIC